MPRLVYLGFHKAASSYVHGVLDRVAAASNSRVLVGNQTLIAPYNWSEDSQYQAELSDFYKQAAAGEYEFLVRLNAHRRMLDVLDSAGVDYRAFSVIRDPRDVLVSAYFSHLNSHPDNEPWMADHREALRQCGSVESGLLCELDRVTSHFLESMGTLAGGHEKLLQLRFEELIESPYYCFRAAMKHCGLRIKGPRLHSIIKAASFERQSGGRARGDEDANHHYRKGVAGDWRNYFTPDVTAEFKRRFGWLLIEFGYESGIDWQAGI